MLVLHRRDDGCVAEEVFHSVRDRDGGGGGGRLDCDHLSGGLLGFQPADPSARGRILSGQATAVVTESESLVHTGRFPKDEGDEPVRVVELLITERFSS
ncbi:hypothetical protein F0L17_22730 [Streptomyces sp. TRM43335]|uniref:Uncharacterized protein n=1 Tax=Streptomyces taklimakanensis TaxID=2569853 RepID=A0A6G2BHY8_9ACTN|nr:hypothetical protein [Streptomyces taklimakanensis]MTE21878.1 hypothetical protein [Streptomyces taklimakanensis]